jgi:hypothetical protein
MTWAELIARSSALAGSWIAKRQAATESIDIRIT